MDKLIKEKIQFEDSTKVADLSGKWATVKKFFILTDENTAQFENKPYVDFVNEMTGSTKGENLIKCGKISINGIIQTDINFQLQTGDVVRNGVMGHFIQGPESIAVVK